MASFNLTTAQTKQKDIVLPTRFADELTAWLNRSIILNFREMKNALISFVLIVVFTAFRKPSINFEKLRKGTETFNSLSYKGKPWNDKAQEIPGKIQCEWYDLGGEGISYHDKDSVNNGSGKLNPANGTFLNEFRMKEGVDISYTKARDIDNSPFNIVEPIIGAFYVGWTVPNEWINYSIKVNKTGFYKIDLMFTASGDGGILLLIDGKEICSEIVVPSTRNEKETISWRQWHHWNKMTAKIPSKIKKGKHILTLKTVTNGNMNYDYIDFQLLDK